MRNAFMHTLIIYESIHHGNTKKVAERMAKVLNAKLQRASDLPDLSIIRKFDLVGFGSGIYFSAFHKNLLELISKLPDSKTINKKAFVFCTSGSEQGFFNKYKGKLNDKLSSKGFEIIGEFSSRAWDSWGLLGWIGGINKDRPNKEDLKKAEEFAKEMKEKI